MSQQIRVRQGYKNHTDPQIIAVAGAVLKGMTGNPVFPAPPVDLKAVQTALDDVQAAIAAQAQGGTAATAHKKNKREELIAMLRKLAHYVEDNCGGDVATVLDCGFTVASPTRTRSALERPTITGIDFGNTTQLVVKVHRVVHAKCYEVRYAAIGDGGPAGPWQTAGFFTNSRSMTVNGLTPGTTYAFQVRALGGATRCTDWSDSVAHFAV